MLYRMKYCMGVSFELAVGVMCVGAIAAGVSAKTDGDTRGNYSNLAVTNKVYQREQVFWIKYTSKYGVDSMSVREVYTVDSDGSSIIEAGKDCSSSNKPPE